MGQTLGGGSPRSFPARRFHLTSEALNPIDTVTLVPMRVPGTALPGHAQEDATGVILVAPTRESLVARTKALDRVLLSGHYVIPNWHHTSDRILSWDRFSRPEVTPNRGTITSLWWYDEEKAAALEEARSRGGSSEHTGIRTTPGIGTMMVVTAAVLLVGFFVFRHVMRRPTMRERS